MRLQLFALAYNLSNFLRRLALPRELFTAIPERIQRFGVSPPLAKPR